MLKGIDFSFGSGLTVAQIKAAGYSFVCRYLSGGSSKDIDAAELANYKGGGIAVVFVWETTGQEYSSAAGAAAALGANAELERIGAAGAPVFFAQDIPEAAGVNPVDYMRGVISVLGTGRSAGYGDYATIRALFDAGVITFGWQTYGGSGGAWDDRADLRQVLNGQRLGPAQVDDDQAAYWSSSTVLGPGDDFGQWPRPAATKPPPPQGPFRHVVPAGETWSLPGIAASRNTTVADIFALSEKYLSPENLAIFNAYLALDAATTAAGLPHPRLPEGFVYWTANP